MESRNWNQENHLIFTTSGFLNARLGGRVFEQSTTVGWQVKTSTWFGFG